MEQIHEPQEADFYVNPRPLTNEERNRISEYTKEDKEEKNERPAKASGSPPESKRAKAANTKRKSPQSI
jgi:hypothetical protein